MKQRNYLISSSIAAALAVVPLAVSATPGSSALAGLNTGEAARVTQVVNNTQRVTLPKTHIDFVVRQAVSSKPLADSVVMNHLQLTLAPSMARTASMGAFISSQHDPNSASFHHWLTPADFGSAFGVQDTDIAAVTAWLESQGLKINSIYPNKLQIDFTGTVGQLKQAFGIQEAIYTLKGGSKHMASNADISVPVALSAVIRGVMGLNDLEAKPLVHKPQVAKWDASLKRFASTQPKTKAAQVVSQAVNFNGTRGLAPNDMATMYGIRQIRANGVTGKGINIAVVESGDMVPDDWNNFVGTFNLGQYGGTFQEFNPPAPSGTNNCNDPLISAFGESTETVLDAEWSTAIAPGANIWVATCSGYSATASGYPAYPPTTNNFFGGVYLAADNLINAPDASNRPDVISASYGYSEQDVDAASKAAIDIMWAQADAEGISVFVSTGDSGSNASFNGGVINGQYGDFGVSANAMATSPYDTAVGGNDLADVLDGTTDQYFAPTPSVVGGSALSYVPEIPWNESCGNGVAAKAAGFSSAVAFCQSLLPFDPDGNYATSEGGSGGPSVVDAKPTWQRQIYNTAKDQSRDIPDVSLFAGSYGNYTAVIICTSSYPCTPGFSSPTQLTGGTSLASPMFAGIQALIDQGLTKNGLAPDQGNAAPTLYALATNEYGGTVGTTPASLTACSADNGTNGTSGCVFHNITRGTNSTQCYEGAGGPYAFTTTNCYFYGSVISGTALIGLTTANAVPTSYGPNKAFPAQPGWSFSSGLGSVNATNLLIAWRKFVNAPPIVASASSITK